MILTVCMNMKQTCGMVAYGVTISQWVFGVENWFDLLEYSTAAIHDISNTNINIDWKPVGSNMVISNCITNMYS